MTYNDILEAQRQAHEGDPTAYAALLAEDLRWTSGSEDQDDVPPRGKDDAVIWASNTPLDLFETSVLIESEDAIVVEDRVPGPTADVPAFVTRCYYGLRHGKIAEMRHVPVTASDTVF